MLLAAGCSSAATPKGRTQQTYDDKTLLDRFTLASGESRWVFRQAAPTRLNACAECVRGFCPCVGDAGELWLDTAPRAELFSERFAEDLIDVWWTGAWHVLGKSGTVYVLAPTGAKVERVLAPPSALQKCIRVGSRLLGVATEELLRSDDAGASWQRLEDGPAWPIDIAADALGRVAMLTVPERLWQSTDAGLHFTPLPQAPNGTTALAVDGNQIRVASFLNGRTPLFAQATDTTLPLKQPSLKHPTADFLRASDVFEHRAVERQEQYVVVRQSEQQWVGYAGQFGRPLLGPWPLPELPCRRIHLEYSGEMLLAICSNAEHADVAQALSFYVSLDAGHHFKRSSSSWFGVPKALCSAPLATTGAALLSGICRPNPGQKAKTETETNVAGCRPSGVFRIAAVAPSDESFEPHIEVSPIDAAGLSGQALAIATNAEGPFAAMLARTTKSGALSLFLSKDGGRTFVGHALADRLDEALTGFAKPARVTRMRPGITEPTRGAELHPGSVKMSRATEMQLGIDALHVDATGGVTLIVRYGDRPRVMTFDSDATLLSSAFAPPGTSRMDGFESQLIALSVTRGALFESHDNGADFAAIAAELGAVCKDAAWCGLVCRKAGCLIGERVTRLGYRRVAPTRIEVPVTTHLETATGAKPSIHCRISSEAWRRIEATGPLPNAISAGFADVAYYFLGLATDDANVLLTEAKRHERNTASRLLFVPRGSGRNAALAIQREAQGWAAARIRQLKNPKDPIGVVDFAWSNLLRGKSGHGHDAAKEPASQLSTDAGVNGTRRFAPVQFSLQGDGLMFQWVSDGQAYGKWSLPGTAPLSIHFDGWHSSSVHSTTWLADGRQLVPVALAEQGMVLLRGSLDSPAIQAQTIAAYPTAVTDEPNDFSYLGHRAGVLSALRSDAPESGNARFFPIDPGRTPIVSDGIVLPRLVSNGRLLRSCDAAMRANSERIVVNTDRQGSLTLSVAGVGDANSIWVTRRAVMYRNAETACWDVLEAEDDAKTGAILAFAEAQQPSWYFRNGKDAAGRSLTELAPIDCAIQ